MDQRTSQQNRALHLLFTQLAETLNDAGLDQRVVLKPEISIPWSADSIKNNLWRPVQLAVLRKESTTDLEKQEIDKVYEVLMRHLGEKFGVFVDFPCEESLTSDQKKHIL